jgi:hypothetical protein
MKQRGNMLVSYGRKPLSGSGLEGLEQLNGYEDKAAQQCQETRRTHEGPATLFL